MLRALIITLREGVEAALIVGITLAYLSKIGRQNLRRIVYAALIAACVCSVAAAMALSRTQFNQDIFEGAVMLVAAFFVVTMLLFMMRAAKSLKGDIERRVDTLASKGSLVGLFIFVFLMILREGVETVLILAGVSFTTSELFNFIGTLIGVALAIAFGVIFVKGSVRINLRRFFKVTTVILFFVAVQLTVSGLHELSENGILPSSKREMAIIGPIVRNDSFFSITIVALAALMALFEYRRRSPRAVPSGSKAEQRKAQWSAGRERFWMAAVYASSFIFILLMTAEFIYAKSTTSLSPAILLSVDHGAVNVPMIQVSDGDLHRYRIRVQGEEMRFLLFQRPDGKIATVLDACQICGPVGYYRSGTGIICKNCSAPVNPQSVGEPGGCNPIPLKSQVVGENIQISEADLLATAALMHH